MAAKGELSFKAPTTYCAITSFYINFEALPLSDMHRWLFFALFPNRLDSSAELRDE